LSEERKVGNLIDSGDPYDVKMIDGLRVLCLVWSLSLGVCQFTMSSAVQNPWSLEYYFQTFAYTAVYSSNLGLDEFFFLSSLLCTLKQSSYMQYNNFTVTTYLKALA